MKLLLILPTLLLVSCVGGVTVPIGDDAVANTRIGWFKEAPPVDPETQQPDPAVEYGAFTTFKQVPVSDK
jgi:hypothetical protein